MLRRRRRLRAFRPRGRPRPVGRRGIGDVAAYGPTRSATLIVGLNKGNAPQNQRGVCSRFPAKVTPAGVDSIFLEARKAQVGKENVGATRREGRGWYQGEGERSVAYEVIFIPGAGEDNWSQFKKNMGRLAETMAKRLCQDEVILVTDNAGKKSTFAASCPRRESC